MKRKIFVLVLMSLILLTFFGCNNNTTENKPISSTPTNINENSSQPASQPSTTPAENNKVQSYIDNMSLYEKICQMFIVTPEELTGVDTASIAGETTKNALEKYPVGGIVYFYKNIISSEQFYDMIKNSQSFSKIPLFIATDEEGGDVARVSSALDINKLNPMYEYRNNGTSTATHNAEVISEYLQNYGVNTDFAPVADVWSNPDNTVIGTRAYSSDYNQTAELVSAAVKGFKNKNEICTLKHFPGHGDTSQDSHQELAHITKTVNELRNQEFLSFKSGIDAGADMVMVGHLIIDEFGDNTPATLNSKIVTDILRNEIGFEGVIITDSMEMGAIVNNYGIENAVIMAVQAGNDIILQPSNLDKAVLALNSAVNDGIISEDRINQSVSKIIALKINHNII